LRPFSRLQSLTKHVGNKQTFYIKNVCEDLAFAMMIKKVGTSFVGDQGGKNLGFRGYFKVQVTLLPASTHQTCSKSVFGCFTTSHPISSQTIDRKILFGNKIEISTRWLSSFQGLVLVINPQLLRLAACLSKVSKASE